VVTPRDETVPESHALPLPGADTVNVPYWPSCTALALTA
jgi:hypothetical protein